MATGFPCTDHPRGGGVGAHAGAAVENRLTTTLQSTTQKRYHAGERPSHPLPRTRTHTHTHTHTHTDTHRHTFTPNTLLAVQSPAVGARHARPPPPLGQTRHGTARPVGQHSRRAARSPRRPPSRSRHTYTMNGALGAQCSGAAGGARAVCAPTGPRCMTSAHLGALRAERKRVTVEELGAEGLGEGLLLLLHTRGLQQSGAKNGGGRRGGGVTSTPAVQAGHTTTHTPARPRRPHCPSPHTHNPWPPGGPLRVSPRASSHLMPDVS